MGLKHMRSPVKVRSIALMFVVACSSLSVSSAQSIVSYGPGHGMKVTGIPRLGQTVTLDTDRSMGGFSDLYSIRDLQGMLIFGIDRVQLPFQIGRDSRNMVPKAFLLTTPLLFYTPAKISAPRGWSYATAYALPIPNNTNLIGATLHAQWLYHYTGSINYYQQNHQYDYLDASDAVIVTVGR